MRLVHHCGHVRVNCLVRDGRAASAVLCVGTYWCTQDRATGASGPSANLLSTDQSDDTCTDCW